MFSGDFNSIGENGVGARFGRSSPATEQISQLSNSAIKCSTPSSQVQPLERSAPFNVSTAEAIRLFGSSKLFKRLRFHHWIEPLEISAPGRPSLYPLPRLAAAQARMEGGDFPPPLPSEEAEATRRFTAKRERTQAAHFRKTQWPKKR